MNTAFWVKLEKLNEAMIEADKAFSKHYAEPHDEELENAFNKAYREECKQFIECVHDLMRFSDGKINKGIVGGIINKMIVDAREKQR